MSITLINIQQQSVFKVTIYCSRNTLAVLKFMDGFNADTKVHESNFLFSWRLAPVTNERPMFCKWAGSARTCAHGLFGTKALTRTTWSAKLSAPAQCLSVFLQMSPAPACLCVLCGLPAAGKSRLALELRGHAHRLGWTTLLVTYDELIPARDWQEVNLSCYDKHVIMVSVQCVCVWTYCYWTWQPVITIRHCLHELQCLWTLTPLFMSI